MKRVSVVKRETPSCGAGSVAAIHRYTILCVCRLRALELEHTGSQLVDSVQSVSMVIAMTKHCVAEQSGMRESGASDCIVDMLSEDMQHAAAGRRAIQQFTTLIYRYCPPKTRMSVAAVAAVDAFSNALLCCRCCERLLQLRRVVPARLRLPPPPVDAMTQCSQQHDAQQ